MTIPIIRAFIAWNQPFSGNWSASQNWTYYHYDGSPSVTGVQPTSSDVVNISQSGTYVVTLDVPAEVKSLDLVTQSLYIGQTLKLRGGYDYSGYRFFSSVSNNGIINIDSLGSLEIGQDSGISVYGTVINQGSGTLRNFGKFDNHGSLYNYGTQFIQGDFLNDSLFVNYNTSENFSYLNNSAGAILNNYAGADLYNGSIGTLDNAGIVINSSVVDNFGIIANSGTFLSDGEIKQYPSASFIDNGGTLAGSGSFKGDINLKSGSIAPGGKIVSGSYADTAGTFTVNGAINLNGGTIKLSVTGVKPGEYDNLIASSAAFNSGKVQISISNSDLDYINSEIAPGQKVSIPVLTVNGGLKLSSSFIASGIISPISDSHDIFKVSKSGNTLFLNITHI